MSLLLGNGHANPYRYPLGRLWTEAEMVRQREADRISTEVVGIDAAITAALNGKKKNLTDFLEELRPQDG